MRKIRLHFISAPISLFWSLAALKSSDQSYEDVYVVTGVHPEWEAGQSVSGNLRRYFPDLSSKSDETKADWKSVNQAHSEQLVDLVRKWTGSEPLVLFEPSYEAAHSFSVFHPKSVLAERARKRAIFRLLDSFLEENRIPDRELVEVCYSQSTFPVYLKWRYPRVLLRHFDHGLGDIVNLADLLGPKRGFRRAFGELKRRLRARIGIFDSLRFPADIYHTVFSEVVTALADPRHRGRVRDIPLKDILTTTHERVGKPAPSVTGGTDAESRVLFLLPNISGIGLSSEQEDFIFSKVVGGVLNDLERRGVSRPIVYLKARSDFLVRYADPIRNLERFQGAQFRIFEHDFGEVPVVEAFLGTEKFAYIYGSLSSALALSKIWDPRIVRITIHRLLTDALAEIGEAEIPDYARLDRFYFESHVKELREWLPIRA